VDITLQAWGAPAAHCGTCSADSKAGLQPSLKNVCSFAECGIRCGPEEPWTPGRHHMHYSNPDNYHLHESALSIIAQMSALDAGLKSLDTGVSSQCAAAVDNLAGFYFKATHPEQPAAQPSPAAQVFTDDLSETGAHQRTWLHMHACTSQSDRVACHVDMSEARVSGRKNSRLTIAHKQARTLLPSCRRWSGTCKRCDSRNMCCRRWRGTCGRGRSCCRRC